MDLKQVFEYAIEQEIKAKEFYESSAANTDNPSAASLLRSLANMEAGHRRALENELDALMKLGKFRAPEKKPATPQEEMLSSLQNVAQVLKEANVELETKQKRFESELRMAGEIQIGLLPKKIPQLAGLEISVACFMASHVGGDYYDFLFDPAGRLHITIGDVSGKGLPAALLMVATRTLWRSAARSGNSPEKITHFLSDDMLSEFSESDQFVTLISCMYTPVDHTFSFSNAGHWPPLYLPGDKNEFELLPPGHLPIGISPEADYKLFQFSLAKDDLIVMFSDGLVEARDKTGKMFGEAHLSSIVLENRNMPAETIREKIIHSVDKFSGPHRQDDQTIVVLKSV